MSRPLLVALACLALARAAVAHHGPGTFDLSRTVTLTGRLTRVDLINPHSWLYFDVTEPDGRVSHHRCEMRSVHVLRRSGWTKEMFPNGQRITVEASPDRVDPTSCYLQTITFPDGSHMDRYGQYLRGAQGLQEVRGPLVVPAPKRPLRRPTGEPDISGEWAAEQVVMVNPKGVGGGMVPLGQLGQYTPGERPATPGGRRGAGAQAGPRLYGGTELTPLGEQAAASFKREDNPRFRCETTSILFDWAFDGPVNRITQHRDTIVLEYGQLGLKRTIFMNMKEHPRNVKPTRTGHSIGRWENDVLVVDTVGFLPGVLNAPVRHSDKLHVVERFALDPATMKLTRSYVAEDPVYLKGQYKGSDVLQIADAPYDPGTCKDTSFIDFSKQASR